MKKNGDTLRAPPVDISIQDNPIETDEDNEKALNLFVIASKQNYTLAKYHDKLVFKYFETVTNKDCRRTIENWLLLYQGAGIEIDKKKWLFIGITKLM
ncbi:hypothetical protein RhiirA4_470320 [Rhizophagus irregularis]|uniref:Uncharacterized protein n=1 Tax=Rhizophagus irregularis TaxID=588596 RepID=A0A2I1H123_9GLOM|nr:hypothetical protein RhiirA4_470320 [Rhizophagus irregularis]